MRAIPRLLLAALIPFASARADIVIPDNVIFERGIEFSNPDNQHLQLNIARPKHGDGPFPAIVCIHGGGFRAGARESYDAMCVRLAGEGFVALTVTYRLSPAYQFPAAVHDCKAAVRWLRTHAATYHADPVRIGAMGGSAGGHLALFLGVTAGVREFEGVGHPDPSTAVQCVVSYSGPSDFTKSYGKSVDAGEVLPLFFGGDLSSKRHEHIVGSPLNWVTPHAPPTLCIHGTADDYVAFEQAQWMTDRLTACGVEAELLAFAGAGHGLKGEEARKADDSMIAFFKRHLQPGAK